MAAKVVIVAVPTVLSIASIRVYTTKEEPTDGLVTRQELNIYTPVPQSAQAQFVPERPGLIQNGVNTARETIVPVVQAVKGACLSVKRGTVNLYHAGEDVYYYLKDPPPEFLPRFGTITMAGLLGMFLARRGSRFKRVVVPGSLMTAGAIVCYPAQAVAMLKVTGKKVYAAGQWSRATVSSLLTPKPQEPAAKETAASQPQAAEVPSPESVQSSTIPETEVESAESVPASDEPVVAVVTEEASSAPVAEISPDQTPTETNTVPAETKSTAEESPAPVESEEPSAAKPAAEDEARPAESPESSEPETVEAAPAGSAPAGSAPVEATPAEVAPVEAAPVEVAPAESAPSSEEPPAPKASDEPAVVESADPEPAPQPELPDPPQHAAVEETLTPPPPPQPEAAAAEDSKGGSAFKPDPALMDFGQSSPEDEDLYSTRS